MQYPRKVSIAGCCAVLLAILFPIIADGCSIFYPTVHVWKTFRVKVMDRGRPVQGLRLLLRPFSHDSANSEARGVSYSRTDSKGYAQFDDLVTGSYFLSSEFDSEIPDGAIVDVSPDGAVNLTIQLRWPSAAPLRTQSVRGTLRLPDYYPQQTQAQLSLSLLEAISGRVIEMAQTDNKGRFAFNNPVKPGLYFLNLGHLMGTITIEVNRDAEEDGVDLNLGRSSCGPSYAHRRIYPEIRLKRICGNVTDSLGSAIPEANVWLLSNGEDAQVIEQTKTDETGQFVLQEQNERTYQLIIKRLGFQPFIQAVHLETTEKSDQCRHPIRVSLEPE